MLVYFEFSDANEKQATIHVSFWLTVWHVYQVSMDHDHEDFPFGKFIEKSIYVTSLPFENNDGT